MTEMTTDTIQATIEAWQAAQPEGTFPKFQLYEPNGGTSAWTPAEFASDDFLSELLDEEWETAELKDGCLDLFRHRGPVLRYASLTWHVDPSGGRERVAYLGAHCGFEWEHPDERVHTDTFEAALRYCMWDDEALAEFGLACCEDYLYGDDGGFWLVADPTRFERAWRLCRGAQASYDDQEREPDAEEVIEMLKCCIEP